MSDQPIILDRNDVMALFRMTEAIACAREAFSALSEGAAVMPQRLALRVEEHQGTHLSMPCYVRTGSSEILTLKIATVFEKNPQRLGLPTTLAFLVVQDPESGALLALMDAEYLTAQRTGAASAIATDLLADPKASRLAVFGAGGQAQAQVEAMVAVRPIDHVTVVALNMESAHNLASRLAARFAVEARAEPNAAFAVADADIICTATNSMTPTFASADVKIGIHVNAIGAFRRDMRELDPALLSRSLVVVDQLQAAQSGAGDLIQAAEEGLLDWSQVRELGPFLKEGRQKETREVTVFKSVGLAVQDAVAANFVYRQAKARGLGQPFRLH